MAAAAATTAGAATASPPPQPTTPREPSPHLNYGYLTEEYMYYSSSNIGHWRKRRAQYARGSQLAWSAKTPLAWAAVAASTVYLVRSWPRRTRLIGVANAALLPWTLPRLANAVEHTAQGLAVAAHGAEQRVRAREAAHELWFAPEPPPGTKSSCGSCEFGAGFCAATDAYHKEVDVDVALLEPPRQHG